MPKRSTDAYARLSLRIKEPLRARCEESAHRRGVSMNTEIADRLERSFDTDQTIEAVFGSREIFAMMRMMASVLEPVGRSAGTVLQLPEGSHWLEDPFAYDQAVKAMNRVLDVMRPEGEATPRARQFGTAESPGPDLAPLARVIGGAAANGLFEALAGRPLTPEMAKLADDVHRDLGSMADRVVQWRKRHLESLFAESDAEEAARLPRRDGDGDD